MACWVVPALAADYWQIDLEQVLDRIRRHAVPTRTENGFTFVDVLPDPHPPKKPTFIPTSPSPLLTHTPHYQKTSTSRTPPKQNRA